LSKKTRTFTMGGTRRVEDPPWRAPLRGRASWEHGDAAHVV
jgi:hypothetical protein